MKELILNVLKEFSTVQTEITPETKISSLKIDELDQLSAIESIEKDLSIMIPRSTINDLTVSELYKLVADLITKKRSKELNVVKESTKFKDNRFVKIVKDECKYYGRTYKVKNTIDPNGVDNYRYMIALVDESGALMQSEFNAFVTDEVDIKYL